MLNVKCTTEQTESEDYDDHTGHVLDAENHKMASCEDIPTMNPIL